MSRIVAQTLSQSLLVLALLVALSACGGGNAPPGATPLSAAGSSSGKRSDAPGTDQLSGSEKVSGRIFGLGGVRATVILGDQARVMMSTETDAEGRFEFNGVPYGAFFVKAEARSLAISPAQVVTVNPPTVLATFGSLRQILPAPPGMVFTASSSNTSNFSFHWDTTSGGQESTAHIVAPPVIQFRDEKVTPPDTAASALLYSAYNVVLSDEGVKWTQEAASRLLTTLGTVPTTPMFSVNEVKPFRKSKWILTNKELDNDIRIERSEAGDTVVLSAATLVYATPRLVYLDGVPGKYFSKRLHHAAVRFVTNDGKDSDAADRILTERFGLRIKYLDYGALTASTTRESYLQYADFKPEELVDIINILEEMPEGFHKITGLHTLVRRGYGQVNPQNRDAIATAYTDAGYIELTDAALVPSKTVSPHRVMLHEKAHFLWAKVFSSQQKSDWTTLGGWFRNPANSKQWLTSQSTGFVSALAHEQGPDEDMAESLADYILNPSLLQSRALAKFNFIRDRIFKGDRFVPVIRDDLTFTVVDLFPDYTAPGKAKSIDISLKGAPPDDKFGNISIELFGESSPSAGAKQCIVMLVSPSGKPATEAFALYPKDALGNANDRMNSTSLSGNFRISKYWETGYWRVTHVDCNDLVGNVRYLTPAEVGNAAIYVNNSLQSTTAPAYEPGSMSITEIAPGTLEGRPVRRVQTSWRVKPHAVDLTYFSADLVNIDNFITYVSPTTKVYDKATRTVTMTYDLPDYLPTARYGVSWVTVQDEAGNISWVNFMDPANNEAVRYLSVVNVRPDSAPPELDLNRISVTATPTRPQAPDGETLVKITVFVRDDVSGLNSIYFNLLNPQGEITQALFYTNKTPAVLDTYYFNSSRFFSGDPTVWQRYEVTITLPVGSAPGKWGISSIGLTDKARLFKTHDFVELMHFVVDK